MKYYILTLTLFLLTTILSACSDSETEKQLNGEWYGETSYLDDEGDACTIKLALNLDNSSHDMRMDMTMGMSESGEILTVSFSGSWKADPETLWLNIKDEPKIEFTPLINTMASYYGISVKDIETQLKNQMNEEVTGLDFLDIKRIYKNYFILKLDDFAEGAEITMFRQTE